MNDTFRASSALHFLNPSCSREEWVRTAMAAKDAALAFEDFHSWSKKGTNYKDEKDCRAVWNSVDDSGGIKAGTLFYLAKEKGWQDPNKMGAGSSISISAKKGNHLCPSKIWEASVPATYAHEYIVRKQGNPAGLRVYPTSAPPLIICGQNVAGYLVVPCQSDGQIQTLQFIPPNEGEKLNLNGATFGDGYFVVGEISRTTSIIYSTESIGNAWAIYRATNTPAVVFFGSSRMARVASVLRAKYPYVILTLVPDKGGESKAAKIAFEIGCQWIELPQDKSDNYDVNDYAKEHGYEALANLLADAKIPELRYKLLSVKEVCNLPPMDWILKGIIPKVGLAALYGPSSSGKSFLLLDLALTIVTGEAFWFGRRINAVPITYVCLEGESGLGKRVKAWFTHTNKELPKSIRFMTQPFNLLTDDVNELVRAIVLAGNTGGMIILDTLNRAAPGADENSPVDMGKIISSSSNLQRLTGGVVLLAHHTGKDEAKKLRGHSSLPAALDGAIEVTRNGVGRQWTVAKSKDDNDGDICPFKLEIVHLGTDKDGDTITSCVVDFEKNNTASELRQALPPKAGNQKIVWDALKRLFCSSKEYGMAGASVERPCLRLDDVVDQLQGSLPCVAKRQNERIRTAITGLISRGLLILREGWLWSA